MPPSGSPARGGRRTRSRIAVAAVLVSTAAGLLAATPAPAAAVTPGLPDLEQVPPYSVYVYSITLRGKMQSRLTFGSASQNVGVGRLVVHGHRPNVATPLMTADQLIDTGDPANPERVPRVGVMRYTRSPDHSHWHLLDFMRYELRRASNFRRFGRDLKTGFCLGNRYDVGVFGSGGAPASGVGEPNTEFDRDCGQGRRRLLNLEVGISPGQGDDYRPDLEGQWIDITKLRSGRYFLVHRSNPRRRMRESNYANNVASAQLIVTNDPRGRFPPRVKVLRTCWRTARCR
nr:lysyl oxidase family protein [Actinomycetota bacterium]